MALDRTVAPSTTSPAPGRAGAYRWWLLLVVTLAQVPVVLGASLPEAVPTPPPADLGIDSGDVVWMGRAHLLALGALLLPAGRLADLVGPRRTFTIGLIGLAGASLVVGTAGGPVPLFAGRTLQGAFGALVLTAGLALLITAFTDRAERGWVLGLHAGVAAAGGGLGMLVAGASTGDGHWRVLPCAQAALLVALALGALRLFARHREPAHSRITGFDLPGALAATIGVGCVLYGCLRFETHGERDTTTWLFLAVGGVLLGVFARRQALAGSPLLPPRIVLNRDRGAALLGLAVCGTATTVTVRFVAVHLRSGGPGFTASQVGPRLLPLVLPLLLTAPLAGGLLLRRIGAKTIVPIALGLCCVGFVLLYAVDHNSSYPTNVVPALLLIGFGAGLAFGPCVGVAVDGVRAVGAGAGATVGAYVLGAAIGVSVLARARGEAFRLSGTPQWEGNPMVPPTAGVSARLVPVYEWTGVLLAFALVATAVLFSPRSRVITPAEDA
ncbi:MFS transporter [Embleya scabrispora]|uniref:MFS transporter n=1 Tax=Embleya scabrispora TaxID=159449 RepID=UPI00037178C3|nr:MFS transporter [Embleya scabrispora]MYS85467.1 MFS transporter [Streptomyces sp. SID5474]